ncbi:hypothetical protein BIY27_19845 [Gibbsiella quercinecans]|nr:hypothetical protein BIY27_19845 [Gibbsiella quercinecans]
MIKHYHYRIGRLLKLLHEAAHPLTSTELCEKLAIKPRTLRNDLSRYKEALNENGVELHSRPGTGYQLVVRDEEKYRQLIEIILQTEHRHHFVAPVRYQERVDYILRSLLSAEGYIKLDELAEEIYISRSTLNSCMKGVRHALSAFNLILHAKTASGIKVAGSELNIRQAMAKYFFYNNDHRQPEEDNRRAVRQKIVAILTDTLKEHQLVLTDTGFQNLVVHLEIALMRIDSRHGDVALPVNYTALKKRDEYRVAEQLVIRIERAFAIPFPAAERYFITIHLAGKRSLHHHQTFAATPDISRLFDKISQQIVADFAIDLADDFELFHLLSLHFIPMMDRLNWDLKVHNPLLEDIKQDNLKAFEMAVLAGKIVQQETGLEVNEAEIGYLAIHFGLAIDRQGAARQRYNLIFVCASGMGSSQLLLYKIRQRFSHSVREIKVVQLYELTDVDLTGYDMILSTVDVPFKTAIPLLRVNYFLDARDLGQMDSWLSSKQQPHRPVSEYFHPTLFFTDLQSAERYQLIAELCQRVAVHIPTGSDFLPSVIEREKLSATAFGNAIAFPHPLHPCGERTFVAVALLKKPVCWDKHEVRYIFMLNIRTAEKEPLQWLHESLVSLMGDNKKLATLDQSPTFATLMNLLAGDDVAFPQ